MNWLSDSAIRHLRDVGDWPELGERYEIIEAIGQGGMGKVYRARDRELERDVALKVLNVAHLGDDATRRMIREARILARLEHPGIVPIHDVGALEDGRIYYTMKLVKGSQLDQYACLPEAELGGLLRVFERACEAVSFAHAHGVIHRDLKPQNIMVGAFGEVLVMDWGVAKILGEAELANHDASSKEPGAVRTASDAQAFDSARAGDDPLGSVRGATTAAAGGARVPPSTSAPTKAAPLGASSKTNPGTVLGTPGFMAPEQAAGRVDAIDRRTDVYALGVILNLLSDTSGKTPRPLQAVVDKATHRDPDERYEHVEQLSSDVANYLLGNQVSAYRESLWERISRIVYRFRTPIILVLVYIIVRLLIFIFART